MTTQHQLSARIRTLLAEEADDFGFDQLHEGAKLKADLGMGASQRIAFTYRLEAELGIRLDSDAFDSITSSSATVGDVLAAVMRIKTKEAA